MSKTAISLVSKSEVWNFCAINATKQIMKLFEQPNSNIGSANAVSLGMGLSVYLKPGAHCTIFNGRYRYNHDPHCRISVVIKVSSQEELKMDANN